MIVSTGRMPARWPFWPLVSAAALVAALGTFHVAGRVAVVQRGFEMGALSRQHHELVKERERLRLEIAALRLPARVESYARQKLGMAPPAPDRIVVLDSRPAAKPRGQIAQAPSGGGGR